MGPDAEHLLSHSKAILEYLDLAAREDLLKQFGCEKYLPKYDVKVEVEKRASLVGERTGRLLKETIHPGNYVSHDLFSMQSRMLVRFRRKEVTDQLKRPLFVLGEISSVGAYRHYEVPLILTASFF